MSSGIDPSHDYRHNFLGGLGRAGGGGGRGTTLSLLSVYSKVKITSN